MQGVSWLGLRRAASLEFFALIVRDENDVPAAACSAAHRTQFPIRDVFGWLGANTWR